MNSDPKVDASVNGRETLVNCVGVTKTFGAGTAAVQALRGVDLRICASELLVLAGPSGCGKTTLISIIAGLMALDDGACSVFGRDWNSMSKGDSTRLRGERIGFVFQTFNLIPALTAAENASVPLILHGTRRHAAVQQAGEMLKSMGFDDRMTRALPRDLSGGQQQRVAIARAVVHNPRLIVCDEPTSALDSESGHAVMKLMRDVALSNGRAVLVVTHDERILPFADRVARMEDGHITNVEDAAAHPNVDGGGL